MPVNVSGSDSESRDALLAQADKIKAELDARKMAATLPVPPATMLGSVRMAAIFGPTFRFLPAFHPSNGAALQTSFTAGASFGTMQPLRWMHRFGRVRRAVGQLRRLAMSAEAIRFGEARFELSAAQLPDDAAPTWIALRIAEEEPLFKSGALSLSMRRSLTIGNLSNGTTLIAGLLVDEWSELVPTATEQTAFAVHYDSPGAEAPRQCSSPFRPTESVRRGIPKPCSRSSRRPSISRRYARSIAICSVHGRCWFRPSTAQATSRTTPCPTTS
ncbi:MAG: hypothetical protein HS111_08855 [Kofleriaceae bacterium]|nr:hypothetical protein [Kofleriaceae bacterium]